MPVTGNLTLSSWASAHTRPHDPTLVLRLPWVSMADGHTHPHLTRVPPSLGWQETARAYPHPRAAHIQGWTEVGCKHPAPWPQLHNSEELSCSSVTPTPPPRSSGLLHLSPRPPLPRPTVSTSPDVCILRQPPVSHLRAHFTGTPTLPYPVAP